MDAEGMGDVIGTKKESRSDDTVYDKINRFATFRQVDRWRKMVLQDCRQMVGLEIGCGPGSFAEILEGRNRLDPIQAMLEAAEPRINARGGAGGSHGKIRRGHSRKAPFPDNSFDAACTLFSFRDWFDKRAGLSEALRVLDPEESW